METILPHVIELKDDDRELDLTAIVPEGMPLEIEIGCGNGRFLAARATKNPTIAYIGIERMMERIRRCSKKAHRDNLVNLTFLRVEAGRFVRDLLPDGRVQAMYLFFPDPWPKRRHHKHRFFQREMCDTLARIFIPGGCMYISTDHEEYFKEMYRYLSEDVRFTEIEPLLREADEQTDFERLFLSKGDAIYNCAFRLNG
ncbi:MAG: tRNA (guanosine(46)-N7)-methyltransferase TrmB [bacterium]|nr:tRNA (guanosine(46)-N7)-methyltransferase TrmB [bacterium]